MFKLLKKYISTYMQVQVQFNIAIIVSELFSLLLYQNFKVQFDKIDKIIFIASIAVISQLSFN